MEYIKNEIERCKTEMLISTGEKFSFLYAVQQALEWAINPPAYASPVDTVLNGKIGVMDTPVMTEDCLVVRHQLPS
jgi:hypothetical protein